MRLLSGTGKRLEKRSVWKIGFWSIVLVTVGLGTAVSSGWRPNGLLVGRSEAAVKEAPVVRQPAPRVSCLGRFEPKDGIVFISVRSISGQPSIVRDLKVREGDWVASGQVVAILDSHRQFEETVRNLNAQVAVAQSRVAIAKTGAKSGDLAAHRAEIARLEANLAATRINAARVGSLYDKQAATVTERDKSVLEVETTTQLLNAARSRLLSLGEVRDVDVNLAEAELQAAQASVARAQVDIEPAIVRASSSGRVLKIHAFPGEEVGPKGVLELGRTDQMFVIAEVVESEINRVRVGQKATLESEALTVPLHGTVDSVGTQVSNGALAPTDPRSFSDVRIVEVKIRLDDSVVASRLIHGKVTAVIEP